MNEDDDSTAEETRSTKFFIFTKKKIINDSSLY